MQRERLPLRSALATGASEADLLALLASQPEAAKELDGVRAQRECSDRRCGPGGWVESLCIAQINLRVQRWFSRRLIGEAGWGGIEHEGRGTLCSSLLPEHRVSPLVPSSEAVDSY